MPYERKSGYELKFIDDDHFEIICLDYGDTNSVRRELEDAEFVSNIASVDGRDVLHLQKILGKTSSKEKLISLLNVFFDTLAKYEVETYKEF
ncbi:hypothetical protein KTH73_04425 [Acinetobacter courvalinii]|uniref:hypothetical protein n=1 Tax=Acinetobacter courvalinii TaxID=280147 RepID=UPI0021CD664A|nr:hypothetical protein [Acinetobacter courvalinii]MCU4389973.1 hypothetical protein [Acinetobacter courvalinii]